jgi:hypothetical protein
MAPVDTAWIIIHLLQLQPRAGTGEAGDSADAWMYPGFRVILPPAFPGLRPVALRVRCEGGRLRLQWRVRGGFAPPSDRRPFNSSPGPGQVSRPLAACPANDFEVKRGMDCSNTGINRPRCTCTYPGCSRHGVCCDCVAYHRQNDELPGCFFTPEQESTYDRSVSSFVSRRRRP